MNDKIKNLIDKNVIVCGRLIRDNGAVRFERIDPLEIEKIPEEERAYATTSMGRAIFTIDKDGKTHNFKGVDSHLEVSEIGVVDLVGAKAIEYVPDSNGAAYKISALVFNDKKPEIRINGTSPLEDIEIEGDINLRLSQMGVKVPIIQYIREFSQEYSLKYGLPIKIDGNLSELRSDYEEEDDERKSRLRKSYGDSYIEEIDENHRPETMREYLERIGFLSLPDVEEKVKTLGFSMQEFVDSVDESYSRGQRYGQTERIMGSPFRISDLETYIANGEKDKLQSIFDFSEYNDRQFFNNLARNFGKNIAVLMNNGWECDNLIHRQDFSLSGEFCDDAYFNIFERHEESLKKYAGEPHKAEALFNEGKRRYVGQVMHMASCIKVVQDAMSILGRSDEEIKSVLDDFIDSYLDNLDYKKIGDLFMTDEQSAKRMLLEEFTKKQNWTEKMASQDRREGLVMDETIYNPHIKNEGFYADVSRLIAERMRTRQNEEKKIPIKLFVSNAISQGISKESVSRTDKEEREAKQEGQKEGVTKSD